MRSLPQQQRPAAACTLRAAATTKLCADLRHFTSSHAHAPHLGLLSACPPTRRSGAYYRSFAAASYPAVWALFRRTRCEERHWYEVIREGRPAHLYFDLECPAHLNPQAHIALASWMGGWLSGWVGWQAGCVAGSLVLELSKVGLLRLPL